MIENIKKAASLASLAYAATFFVASPARAADRTEAALPYTVQRSDTLTGLGRDLLVRPGAWQEVARLNQLADPDVIRPGQRFLIPLRLLKSQPAAARLISVSGSVQAGNAPAAAGMDVPEGTAVRTGADSSAVVELADGSRVQLMPGTLAEVVNNRHYALREAGASASTTWFSGLIRLAQGSLETLASKTTRRAEPLQIKTATSVVGVRGTRFRVAMDDPAGRNSRSEVLEGQVRADNPAQQSGADLPMGTGAVIDPAVKEVKVTPLLPAPDLSASAAEVRKPEAMLSWAPLAGASAYRVQVAADERFDLIVREFKVAGPAVSLAGLTSTGGWYTRVRGIDSQGLEGFDSVRLVVVRDALPPPAPAPLRWQASQARFQLDQGQTTLRWAATGADGQPLPATAYRLELAADAAFTRNLQRVQATTGSAALGALKAGPYFIRFQATLADGRVLDSEPYTFELPDNWGLTVFDVATTLLRLR